MAGVASLVPSLLPEGQPVTTIVTKTKQKTEEQLLQVSHLELDWKFQAAPLKFRAILCATLYAEGDF